MDSRRGVGRSDDEHTRREPSEVESSTTSAAGRVLGGRYRLERLLGVGGMGEVWLARHLELGSPVALKLMSPGLLRDAAARARFRREARAAANLQSPHLVAVHDFGEDGGAPYLVMEFLEGETLKEALGKAPITPQEAAAFLEEACSGLGFAHERGTLHRDIKPSNLFIAEIAGHSVLKIVDFGIARVLSDDEDSDVTRSGAILGSPAFMSPELANAERATIANDLWAMAAVAYWMLLGKEPFTGSMVSDTLHRIRTARFTPPSELDPALPPALDGFFARAFSLRVEDRFQSAAELSEAFRAALRGVAVGPPPLQDRHVLARGDQRGSRSAKSPLGLAALVLVLAVATSIVVVASRVSMPPAPPRVSAPVASHLSSAPVSTRDDGSSAPVANTLAPSAVPSATQSDRRSDERVTASLRPNRVHAAPRAAPSSQLTQDPASARRSSGDSVDPLFGIVVKSPRPGEANASDAARAGAGPLQQR